ncbi:PREDICTED: NEP1-interacting protein-like 1 [Camelina sativa]|uniref:NEP1-interacting protein-like 1 n=1 Tax=Camelina sativa TaxID=90675 RepID=A0ABM0SKT4_CAMSA|nr:PREDICTED: NEP1-interacting protein-like 1 [Camelina sativa]
METKPVDVDVHVSGWSHPLLKFLSEVIISRDRKVEELIIDKNDDSVTSFRSYPDDSSPSDPLIYLKFETFEPNYIYQLVLSELHDRLMSKQISDQILVKAQQLRSQCSDLTPQQPLFITVYITLTHKEYIVVPCSSGPSTSTDLVDKESEEEEEPKTCAICLENLLESGCEVDRIYPMPNCFHLFHEECVIQWLNRQKNSCPLCRQPVYT